MKQGFDVGWQNRGRLPQLQNAAAMLCGPLRPALMLAVVSGDAV